MKVDLNRRRFVGALTMLPFAVEAVLTAQRGSMPIIDSHIHLFDKSRPEGSPWPEATMPVGKEYRAVLPPLYRQIVKPFGIVGAIVIEAQVQRPRIEDNQWVLDVAARDPIIVGTVGRLNPESPEFGKHVERFRKDKLFLGIRQLQFGPALEKPAFVANLRLLADAGLSLDAIPANRDDGVRELLRLTDLVPNLRLIIEHYPRAKTPEDRGARDAYMADLSELGKRPHVYMKLSAIVQEIGGKVSTDLATYQDWLDQLWDRFGEDRVIFGSNWPASDNVELKSYPTLMRVTREYVTGKGRAAMEKVFWRNSIPAYRWVKRHASQPQT